MTHSSAPTIPGQASGPPSDRQLPATNGQSTPSGGRPRKRVYALDGLRLLAALMVVAYHLVGRSDAWGKSTSQVFPHLYLPASYGYLGVPLFFLISGFVICMSAWGRTLGDFFTSRVVRLYPAYWFGVLATTFVVAMWPLVRKPLHASDVLVNLTMLHEPLGSPSVDGVYWTLWVEMRFYLLFALVVWRGVTYRNVVMFCALWTALSVLAFASDNDTLAAALVPSYSPYFVAGMAMYLMHRYRPTPLLFGIVGISFLLAQYHSQELNKSAVETVKRHLPWWPAAVVITVAFVAITAVALGLTSGVRWRWLSVAGALTYPLYLIHEDIGWTVIDASRDHVSPLPLLGLVVAGLLVVAWLVHRFVERPTAPLLKQAMADGIRDMRRPPQESR